MDRARRMVDLLQRFQLVDAPGTDAAECGTGSILAAGYMDTCIAENAGKGDLASRI